MIAGVCRGDCLESGGRKYCGHILYHVLDSVTWECAVVKT